MIRPFTLLCFGAFATAGAWLYGVKHSVAMHDRELREIRRETETARERISILRAEWALLNEPDRLRQVAQRHLALDAMQPTHFARAADIDRRLPAAVAFAGAPDLFAPAPQVMLASAVVPAVRAATPAPAAPQAAATVAPQVAATVAQPAARPAPAEAQRLAEAPAPQALAAAIAAQRAEQAARAAAQPPSPPRPAARAAMPQPAPATRPVQPAIHQAPAPSPDPVLRVTRAPEPAARPAPEPRQARAPEPETRVLRAAAPAAPRAEPAETRVARVAPPSTTISSALGGVSALGRSSLPAPVPFGSAQAATLASPLGPPAAR
jgi:hypothetical protein